MLSFLNSWMLSFSRLEDVILFHGVNVIIFEGLDVIVFHGVPYMLSFLKHWLLSFILCYHFLMLSFDVIIWCYHLWYVIIWCYHFSQFANVIIFVLSFFLVQDGCYHLCYHLMLSFFVIISPFFLFPENYSWTLEIL